MNPIAQVEAGGGASAHHNRIAHLDNIAQRCTAAE